MDILLFKFSVNLEVYIHFKIICYDNKKKEKYNFIARLSVHQSLALTKINIHYTQ